MPAEPARRPRLNIYGLVVALMAALAGAAVWALISLWHDSELSFLALPLGAGIGLLVRRHTPGRAVFGAVAATLFVLAACIYALALIASARVAMLLGMNLPDTLGRIGAELALSVAWARLDWLDFACLGGALVLAALCAAARRQSL
jgi:EamA domain-containing membrane protein RarD